MQINGNQIPKPVRRSLPDTAESGLDNPTMDRLRNVFRHGEKIKKINHNGKVITLKKVDNDNFELIIQYSQSSPALSVSLSISEGIKVDKNNMKGVLSDLIQKRGSSSQLDFDAIAEITKLCTKDKTCLNSLLSLMEKKLFGNQAQFAPPLDGCGGGLFCGKETATSSQRRDQN